MRWHLTALSWGVLILALFGATGVASAQPALPRDITQSRAALTDEQRVAVAEYVRFWVTRLTPPADAPDRWKQVSDARKRLTSTLFNAPEVSAYFRQEFAGAIVPELRRILASNDERAALDALCVASEIGTDTGLDLVIDHLNSPSTIRRVAAAGRAKLAVRAFQQGAMKSMVLPDTISRLARETTKAAQAETDPIALQRQFELLDAIYTATLADTRIAAFTDQAQANRLAVLGDRAAKLRTAEVDAVNLYLGNLKQNFIGVPARQTRDGKVLADHIRVILGRCEAAWESAQNDALARQMYVDLLEQCENFLKLIDPIMRPTAQRLNTEIKPAWEKRDYQRFRDDVSKWNDVIRNPPYRD